MTPVNWTMVILGCIGGLIPDAVRLVKSRHNPSLPDYLRSASFWIGLGLLFIFGGLAAWLGGASNAKQALAFGYAAPEFISRILSEGQPSVSPELAGAAEKLRLRAWWAK